jgi:formamidopyrimidine-DNA glycosylase
MPELPDVEVFKHYLDATALHQTIDQVAVKSRKILRHLSPLRLARRLKGRKLASSHRHGKLLLIELADGARYLVLHFGMTGTLKYFEDEAEEPPHTRLLLRFTNGSYLAFDCRRMLGEVDFTEDAKAYLEGRGVGPDALELTWEQFKERLAGKRGVIKSALMDQSLLAGIGNIYADEILFQAGIHPQARMDRLSEEALRQAYDTMREVLEQAIAVQADPARMPASWLLSYRDKQAACPHCGHAIARIKVVGRTAFVCTRCQKIDR